MRLRVEQSARKDEISIYRAPTVCQALSCSSGPGGRGGARRTAECICPFVESGAVQDDGGSFAARCRRMRRAHSPSPTCAPKRQPRGRPTHPVPGRSRVPGALLPGAAEGRGEPHRRLYEKTLRCRPRRDRPERGQEGRSGSRRGRNAPLLRRKSARGFHRPLGGDPRAPKLAPACERLKGRTHARAHTPLPPLLKLACAKLPRPQVPQPRAPVRGRTPGDPSVRPLRCPGQPPPPARMEEHVPALSHLHRHPGARALTCPGACTH